jgi:hypothetical protein
MRRVYRKKARKNRGKTALRSWRMEELPQIAQIDSMARRLWPELK